MDLVIAESQHTRSHIGNREREGWPVRQCRSHAQPVATTNSFCVSSSWELCLSCSISWMCHSYSWLLSLIHCCHRDGIWQRASMCVLCVTSYQICRLVSCEKLATLSHHQVLSLSTALHWSANLLLLVCGITKSVFGRPFKIQVLGTVSFKESTARA